MKIRTLKVSLFFLSLIVLGGCAGGSKLSDKQLSFNQLLNVHWNASSTNKSFLGSKGWVNTSSQDIRDGVIESDEESWSLKKNAKSAPVARLVIYEDDWLYETEITYSMESKENYNKLMAEIKAYNKPKYTQCNDKSHLKYGTIHFYEEDREVFFNPPTATQKWYKVRVTDTY